MRWTRAAEISAVVGAIIAVLAFMGIKNIRDLREPPVRDGDTPVSASLPPEGTPPSTPVAGAITSIEVTALIGAPGYTGRVLGPNRFGLLHGHASVEFVFMAKRGDVPDFENNCDIESSLDGPSGRQRLLTEYGNQCSYTEADVDRSNGWKTNDAEVTGPGDYRIVLVDHRSGVTGAVAFTVES